MQLKVHVPGNRRDYEDKGTDVTVNSEQDILGLGFVVARAVRAWVKGIPLVPSSMDLHFAIHAEMVAGEQTDTEIAAAPETPRPKRKRKASK